MQNVLDQLKKRSKSVIKSNRTKIVLKMSREVKAMKKKIFILMLSSMMFVLNACASTCSVSDCNKEIYKDGICVDHYLRKSSEETKKLEAEIERTQSEINAMQEAIDEYERNNYIDSDD